MDMDELDLDDRSIPGPSNEKPGYFSQPGFIWLPWRYVANIEIAAHCGCQLLLSVYPIGNSIP